MTLSKGAVGNLMNRYRAVLKKCHLMNMFGSLAVAGLLVAGSAVSATANENTATAIAGEGKPVVVDKGVINGRVIGGSAAEGNSAVINGDTSLTFTGGMLNGEIFGRWRRMFRPTMAAFISGVRAVPLMVGRLPCAMS